MGGIRWLIFCYLQSFIIYLCIAYKTLTVLNTRYNQLCRLNIWMFTLGHLWKVVFNAVFNNFSRHQSLFFPIIKVNPQFLIKVIKRKDTNDFTIIIKTCYFKNSYLIIIVQMFRILFDLPRSSICMRIYCCT